MYSVMFLWLLFYDFIEAHVPYVNYWDELAAFLVLIWGAWSVWKNPKLQKQEWIDWICLAVLVVIGALGNLVHPGLQDSKAAIIKDVVALCKFPMIFLVLQRRTVAEEVRQKNIACIAKLSRWILVVTLLAAVLGRFTDLGFYDSLFRTRPAFKFVFSHQTFFVGSYMLIAAVLMAESVSKNRVFLLLDCLLLVLSLRTKGYIFVAFVVMVVILGEKRVAGLLTLFLGSEKEKIRPGRLLVAAAILVLMILVVGKPRIESTLNQGMNVPRTVLHVVGIKILVDFFPLGSGLGTFASYLSGRYYSNVYDLYEVSNVVGMNRTEYNYISDVFWPYIYGQFGIFGLLLYGKLIISMFFRQFHSGISDNSRIAVAAVWIYALIASTSEAYFTNGTGVQMALFLGLLIGYADRKRISEAA